MSPRTVLRSARGAFDLPSIITGVVVVAILTAGVLAAVFGIIPFAQDHGSKQDVAAVRTAEAVAKTKDGRFMDTAGLIAAGYLPGQSVSAAAASPGNGEFSRVADTARLKAAVGVPADAHCFLAVAKSGSGAIFYGSDVSAEARLLKSTDDPGCLSKVELRALIDSIGGFEDGYAPASPAVTGSVADRTTAVFTWAPVEDTTGYRVESRINGGEWATTAENQTDTRAAIPAGETEVVEVRVAARNSSGDSEFGTASVKLADPIVANGGFENALTSWTPAGTAAAAGSPRTGAGSALIGPGTGANTSLIKQTVTIPDNMSSTLTFSYDLDSTGGTAWDNADAFTVQLFNGASVVRTVQNGAAVAGGWVTKTYDVTAQRGKTLTLQFAVSNNGTGHAATARVDDVAITTSPATPTAAPVTVGASANDGTATVTWAAPESPATPITSYTVTPYKDGAAQARVQIAGNPPATRTTFTGLTNGASYAFTVTATNAAGTSPESAKSVTVIPGPVTLVNAGFENGLDGWTASFNTDADSATSRTGVGSVRLFNSTINAKDSTATQNIVVPDNATTTLKYWHYLQTSAATDAGDYLRVQLMTTAGAVLATPGSLSSGSTSGWVEQTIDLSQWRGQTLGLRFLLRDNATGSRLTAYIDDVSLTSTPAKVTAAPAGVSVAAGDTVAVLKWNQPSSPGSTLSGYTVTPYLNGVAQAPAQFGTSLRATITGLINGSSYKFTVRAINTIGASPESAQTPSVTPAQVLLTNGDFEAGVASWTPGGTNPASYSTQYYAGTKSGWVGGSVNHSSTMSQSFTVPASGNSTVSFWYKGGSSECWDNVTASITDGFGSTVATPLNKRVCNSEDNVWKKYSADLSAYKGQTLKLQFSVNNDSQWPSSGYFDEVLLSTN